MKREITEEQIKELAKGNAKVKKWFPEVFETPVTIGKWYKSDYPLLIYIEEIHHHKLVGYGFNQINEFLEKTDFCTRANENNKVNYDKFNFRLATDSEVEEALINEAKKRGFKKGVYYINANNQVSKEYAENNYFAYSEEYKSLYLDGNTIFYDGYWATPVKTYTKEETEKLLNGKII